MPSILQLQIYLYRESSRVFSSTTQVKVLSNSSSYENTVPELDWISTLW